MREMQYQEYIDLQKEKTLNPTRRAKWCGEQWESKLAGFREVFDQHAGILATCGRALCVGARTGQEVQVLRDMGIDAIGIDLVPCEPLVVQGDMHAIPFEDDAFGFIFSNAIDHALYPDKFIAEAERVIRPGGRILLHLHPNVTPDKYGVFYVTDPTRQVTSLFKRCKVVADRQIPRVIGGVTWEILMAAGGPT
jgi:SAM-dependent methyltransferase